VIKIWGRNTSSNVQKVMWAVAEIGLPHERIDVGGPFGKNREPAYLAKNPNGLVPTLEEEDGFLLWESNSIVRYLAAKHRAGVLEPADLHARSRAQAWMDWQLSVLGPAIAPCFMGLVRTPPEKRDYVAIEASKQKTTEAIAILDSELAKSRTELPSWRCSRKTLGMDRTPRAHRYYLGRTRSAVFRESQLIQQTLP
jgi:glutathione S-transferase